MYRSGTFEEGRRRKGASGQIGGQGGGQGGGLGGGQGGGQLSDKEDIEATPWNINVIKMYFEKTNLAYPFTYLFWKLSV